MSRGPGRIERAIRELFDQRPDEAFTADDLCVSCYPGLERQKIARKHRVAVWRAAHKVLASDPDWQSSVTPLHRGRLVLCNRASVPSMVMRLRLHDRWLPTREAVLGRTRDILDEQPPETPEEANAVPYTDGWRLAQRRQEREHAMRAVSNHLALRDADPAERERLMAQRKAEGDARLAELAKRIRATLGKPQVLSTANGEPSTTHKTLADKARALIVENDPDAIRSGLAEIADALDALRAGDASDAA